MWWRVLAEMKDVKGSSLASRIARRRSATQKSIRKGRGGAMDACGHKRVVEKPRRNWKPRRWRLAFGGKDDHEYLFRVPDNFRPFSDNKKCWCVRGEQA